MFLEILVAVGGYRLFKALRRRRPSGSRSAGRVKRSSHEIGEAGEAVAQAKLRTTLQWLCGDDFYLHDGPLLIEHAPGTAFPTAEIDHLAITPFGIFIFETKNWSGRIAPSSSHGKLTRIARNGEQEDRRSPIEQNRSKVRFLREQLPAIWPVEWCRSIYISRSQAAARAIDGSTVAKRSPPLAQTQAGSVQRQKDDRARAAVLMYAGDVGEPSLGT
ncbi:MULTISPECIES: nuclease-related domain-containing protein [unclassified Caballeronia]|uniref:nuclease-related domain-containing protein n=1 Tax=unclassified Caballeronia TaxID=2646786 RepID=UPI0028670C28|nr:MULTISPECIES: nuclease-related domain-containing protein [unclassified Caballeronia]MDR5754971.1 nuclease-related domain-containing protein [Caballeronia sp. LZ024]MDR5845530.1 nuclease-related domain-containing protein [Caballeronia sp. LZ031]